MLDFQEAGLPFIEPGIFKLNEISVMHVLLQEQGEGSGANNLFMGFIQWEIGLPIAGASIAAVIQGDGPCLT